MRFLNDKVGRNLINFVKKSLDNGSGRTDVIFRDLSLKQKNSIEKVFLNCDRYHISDDGSNIYVKRGKPVEKYDLKIRRTY